MKQDFFKFPSTPHLAALPGVEIRNDKVLSDLEREEFLKENLIIEEKVDGSNIGISFDQEGNIRVQNRGAYLHLPGTDQWKKLDHWLASLTDSLFVHLFNDFILFGEWCYARHSVFYDRLPDWFLGFDVYDRNSHRFLSSDRRDALLKKIGIPQVPVLARGRFTYPEILGFISTSKLGDQPAEGIYLRVDQDNWLSRRAKLVSPPFIQTMERHWSSSAIKPNRLKWEIVR